MYVALVVMSADALRVGSTRSKRLSVTGHTPGSPPLSRAASGGAPRLCWAPILRGGKFEYVMLLVLAARLPDTVIHVGRTLAAAEVGADLT